MGNNIKYTQVLEKLFKLVFFYLQNKKQISSINLSFFSRKFIYIQGKFRIIDQKNLKIYKIIRSI